jgi:hypothetical protein
MAGGRLQDITLANFLVQIPRQRLGPPYKSQPIHRTLSQLSAPYAVQSAA